MHSSGAVFVKLDGTELVADVPMAVLHAMTSVYGWAHWVGYFVAACVAMVNLQMKIRAAGIRGILKECSLRQIQCWHREEKNEECH
jgi:hypothetical protein